MPDTQQNAHSTGAVTPVDSISENTVAPAEPENEEEPHLRSDSTLVAVTPNQGNTIFTLLLLVSLAAIVTILLAGLESVRQALLPHQ